MRIEISEDAVERLEAIARREGVSIEALVLQAIGTWAYLDDRERNQAALAASGNALRETTGDRT